MNPVNATHTAAVAHGVPQASSTGPAARTASTRGAYATSTITIAHASQRPSPAPIRTPSSTNTYPDSTCPAPTSTSAEVVAARVAASGVKSIGSTGLSTTTSRPRAAPETVPQRTITAVASRTPARSPAPRALPVSACAAIARASRVKTRKVQTVNAT